MDLTLPVALGNVEESREGALPGFLCPGSASALPRAPCGDVLCVGSTRALGTQLHPGAGLPLLLLQGNFRFVVLRCWALEL